jgi:hypothetical protein
MELDPLLGPDIQGIERERKRMERKAKMDQVQAILSGSRLTFWAGFRGKTWGSSMAIITK